MSLSLTPAPPVYSLFVVTVIVVIITTMVVIIAVFIIVVTMSFMCVIRQVAGSPKL